PKNALTWFEPAAPRHAELCLWAAVIFAVCLSAVASHGLAKTDAEVRVQVGDSVVATNAAAGRLDLNTASVRDLEMLPGIGPRRAQSIVQERQKRGGFSTVWELCEVPGLTRALVKRLEP